MKVTTCPLNEQPPTTRIRATGSELELVAVGVHVRPTCGDPEKVSGEIVWLFRTSTESSKLAGAAYTAVEAAETVKLQNPT